MLDIKRIKEDPDAVKAGLKAKEVDCDAIVDKILELDVQIRALKTSTEGKTAQKNKIGKVVYLCVSCEEISNRVGDLTQRGVVFAPGQDLYSLYAERTVLYEKYADVIVHCDGKEVGEILAEIQAFMSK